ncbi:MAG: ABC transporter substrate-binding protein [Pseudomonadota bacterium]
MKRLLLTTTLCVGLPGLALANCPGITLADMGGIAPGEHPQQYDLSAYEAAASCEMSFTANPAIADLNSRIFGNGDLPPLEERLPEEPLVMVPYESIGKHGGKFLALSNATESGTSDFLSVRHVNLVRYSDDLQTIVPNVAKSYAWNDDFTELTFKLRKGHKWSDGAPFTSADVKFWYDNLMMDANIYETPKDYALAGEQAMTVETPDDETVVFKLAAPKPGLLTHFANSYAQGFQPKHFLGQYHPDINPDADKLAAELGLENGYEVIKAYYGNSDWTDTPSPMLSQAGNIDKFPKHAVPTLESHIVVGENAEGRQLVANPYFFQVDTAGNQLPYISEQDESYVPDTEVRTLKLLNGEVTYKAQSVSLDMAPVLLDGAEAGNFTLDLNPTISMPVVGFNMTHEDEAKREIFANLSFREAMSLAINREEINEVAFFGQGTPRAYTGFSPLPDFADQSLTSYMTEHDPEGAKQRLDALGLADTDGDGFREMPNGDKLVVSVNFSSQELSAVVIELITQSWSNVGIQSVAKEVTPDEYRSAQSSNKLDVHSWRMGQPLPIILGSSAQWVPPFGTYFDARNGMLWAEWVDSNGAEGVEPPEFVKQLMEDIAIFQAAEQGSQEAQEVGARMAETMTKNLIYTGAVLAPSPVYRSNALKNIPQFKTTSYEYYRTYPYRSAQWWIEE